MAVSIFSGLIYKQPDKRSEDSLKKYISKFLEYKSNPDKFIEDYLKQPSEVSEYLSGCL